MTVQYRKAILGNGITLVAESHCHVRSVSVGVWVKVGSGIETRRQNGVSHFIEHMTFKGTETRNALEVATVLEAVGGELNAFTDREVTCYHATVLSEHVDMALDILSDLILRPTFPKSEIEREKKVLLQELSMIQEAPEEKIHDLFFRSIWKDSPLGQPVIGSRETIKSFARANTLRFFKEHYRPENIVISVAGNIEFEPLRERCERYFNFVSPPEPVRPVRNRENRYQAAHKKAVVNSEQLHLIVGFEGVSVKDPSRFDALVLNFYLGGGMSSRLFQEIREKAGLAYTVDCDFIPFSDSGAVVIYLAMLPRSLPQCLQILGREIASVCNTRLTENVLDQIKGQIRGAILLSSDQMETRQESLGRNEVYFSRHVPLEEIIQEIDRVTVDRVHAVANRLFVPEKESTFTLSKIKPKQKEVTLFHA